jgi:RIO kinase 1
MATKGREDMKTYGNVFDQYTFRNLHKLSGQGYFEELESPIAVGKESNVFSASREGEKVIVKIYRLETCDFNRMYNYIKLDPRYANLKKKKREIIFAWAQREFRNLNKARRAQVRVPTPLTFVDNIIVMEMIGKDAPAPKLKDKHPENPEDFFNQVKENMKKLYKADLVHGDLSQFNILNFNEKPVIIDFSQSGPLESSNSEELLERDARNICAFFNKIGLKKSEKGLLDYIKG